MEDHANEKLVEVNYQPYNKKRYFFSVPELKFFEFLKEIIGSNYYIFPKVRICDIIEPKNKGKYVDFNRIKSKHVDFLICTKDPITSKIIVELDDKSHDTLARQERDNFVDEIFANSEIPIVHIRTQYEYNKEEVTKKILEAYKTRYSVKKKEEIVNRSTGCGGLVLIIFIIIITAL